MPNILLALSPILLILFLIFLFKQPLSRAAPVAFIYTAIITLLVWQMDIVYLYIASLKGLLIAFDILLIIFGAIFFLEFLQVTNIIGFIKEKVLTLSGDIRIQVILIVWFFGSFIEGIAGFGTPAAITAPLLVIMGLNPVLSVAVALVGNSTAVSFGAVGTPIRIGFAPLGIDNLEPIIFNVGLINLFAGILVPLMLVTMVVISRPNWRWLEIKEIIPLSWLSGLFFTLPYFILGKFGYEFPSLLGALIGLALMILLLKSKLFLPANSLLVTNLSSTNQSTPWSSPRIISKSISNLNGLSPYLFLVLFLLLGKFYLPTFNFQLLDRVPYSFNLFNPGLAFLLTILSLVFLFKIPAMKVKLAGHQALKSIFLPFIAILFVVALTQLMIYSGNNQIGQPGMINIIAGVIDPNKQIFLAPIIGAFGAFFSGSATVSNILFGNLQLLAAYGSGIALSLILALQLIGASIGNMIALSNIVIAQAAVNLKDKESVIIKQVFFPFLIYLLAVILIALIINSL